MTRFLKTAEGRGLPSESAMGVLGEWWSSRVLLNCFTEASCKEASRQESEVMVDWREKGLLGVKAVMDSGGP